MNKGCPKGDRISWASEQQFPAFTHIFLHSLVFAFNDAGQYKRGSVELLHFEERMLSRIEPLEKREESKGRKKHGPSSQ